MRARVAIAAGLTLIAPLIASCECIAQKPLRVKQVCGQVIDFQRKNGWPHARLVLRAQDGRDLETHTDDNGEFTFESVPKGSYQLSVFLGEDVLRSQVPIAITVTKSGIGACRMPIEVGVGFLPEVCAGAKLRRRSGVREPKNQRAAKPTTKDQQP